MWLAGKQRDESKDCNYDLSSMYAIYCMQSCRPAQIGRSVKGSYNAVFTKGAFTGNSKQVNINTVQNLKQGY